MADANVHPDGLSGYDASDPKQVEKARREQERREKEAREVLAQLLSTPGGRNWMWQLLESCNVFAQSFVPGDPESSTFFNEGRRAVGLQLMAEITRVHPESLIQMMKERGKA